MSRKYDPRYEAITTPSRDFIERYRADFFEDELDISLAVIHYRGGKEEFSLGLEYCESVDSGNRQVGAQILGQLGWSDQTYRHKSIKVLMLMLRDKDDQVIASAAYALGHRSSHAAIDELVKLADHWSVDVRRGVVSGLSGLENQRAIDGLIQLSTDEDIEVRNWAVFGLGTQIETNTNEICEALRVALDNQQEGNCKVSDEVRGEALVGLAVRGVRDITSLILKEWEREFIGRLSLEAAEAAADPALLPRLVGFKENMDFNDGDKRYSETLDAAIKACTPKPVVEGDES